MKLGKLPENILKRSILKSIKTKRSEVLRGSGVGEDCAILDFNDKDRVCVSTQTTAIAVKGMERFALIRGVNNLSASGATAVSAQISITLPETSEESDLKDIMQGISRTAESLNLQISGGHTEVSANVTSPIITATMIGVRDRNVDINRVKPGDDIIITKWIGLEGTVILAGEKESELTAKFPQKMIYDAASYERYLAVESEAALAVKSGATGMHDASLGGVFSALWEIGERAGVGLEIDLRKIPVKQETIEICNFFDLNPYELASSGAMIITAADGLGVVMKLAEAGINAEIVGKVTDNNDKVVINGETRRFLEPSRNEELYKILK